MRYLIRLILIVFLGITSACSRPLPLEGRKPLIIVSVSPYDTFVKNIAGDTLDVRVAVPANYNSHIFEPTPKQMQGFHHAAIWFGIGEPFEHTLLQALTSHNHHLIQVDLSRDLPLEPASHMPVTLGACASHDHHHESIDLHFWMSPRLASIQADYIASALIARFPEHQELYKANLIKLKNRFETLDRDLHTLLQPVHDHAIVISHPSLGYFCKDYHLIQISIECEGKTPVPGDLLKILDLARQYPIACAFTQEQFDNKGTLTIARRLKLPVYSINPNNPDYFNNIELIAQEIAQDTQK